MSIYIAKFQVIGSDERDIWRGSDIISRQAFPATGNFDLEAGAFGRLAVHNDDVVSPGEGFDMHQHENMEIFTWIVEGRIAHRDSTGVLGAESVVERGTFTYINAGTGIRHAEVNADDFTSRSFLRIVQMWILPDQQATTPSYQTADIREELASGHIFLVAGPEGSGARVTTVSDRAKLYGGVLRPAPLADAPSDPIALEQYSHIYCVRGRLAVEVEGQGVLAGSDVDGVDVGAASGSAGVGDLTAELGEGDQLRITLSAGTGDAPQLYVRALEPDSEVVIWTMKS